MRRAISIAALLTLLLIATITTISTQIRIEITITNPNSYDLVDYQVKVDLSSVLNDPKPLKIVDENGNPVPFCFEQPNGECGTVPSLVVWIRVPKIPAKGRIVLYAIVGTNNAATGDKVFIFYDDFETTSYTWSCTGKCSNVYKNNGKLYVDALDGGWYYCNAYPSGKTFVRPFIVEALMKYSAPDYPESIFVSQDPDNVLPTSGHNLGPGYRYWPSKNAISVYNGLAGWSIGDGIDNPYDDFYLVKFVVGVNGKLHGEVVGYNDVDASNDEYSRPFYLLFIDCGNDYQPLVIEWVRVRSYADQEPSIVLELVKEGSGGGEMGGWAESMYGSIALLVALALFITMTMLLTREVRNLVATL